ncbi:MAG: hypothetical protein KDD11_05650, partial [Acidobacteria bacterium]|nr:hypothetical protein [Acidobacteriota bacterium]
MSSSVCAGSENPKARAVAPPAAPPRRGLAWGLGVLLGTVFGLPLAALPAPPPPLAAPVAVYQVRLEAHYDPESRQIDGFEHLAWSNTASVPIYELRFHHYLNAFANNRSTFMLGGAQLRGMRFDGEHWGFLEVSSIRLADGIDLKPAERFIAPDDGNEEDRTVAVYPLPEPLLPGESVELDIEFLAQLPSVFARTGAEGEFVMAG